MSRKENIRLYRVWRAMKNRCYNPNYHAYSHYGGRGIVVCDEWRDDFAKFERWAIECGYDPDAPYGECTLDRIDVNGIYEPSNCRWVNFKTQRVNQRHFQNIGSRAVVAVDDEGSAVEYPSIKEASRITGIPCPHITAVCKGRTLHAGGFSWRYKNPTPGEEQAIRKRIEAHEEVAKKRPLPVCMTDTNGSVISKYTSIREASRMTGLTQPMIKKLCDGIKESIDGKRFIYA